MRRVFALRRRMVSLLAWGMLAAVPLAARSQEESARWAPSNPASGNPCLKYLPKDYWLVGNFDFKTFAEFAAMAEKEQAQNPNYAMYKQAMQMVQLMTGIDPEKDVTHLTGFVAGNPDVKPAFVLVVKGSFDDDRVKTRLRALIPQGESETYKDNTLYVGPEVGFCFPEQSTLLVGQPALLRQAIDGASAKTPMPKALKQVLDQTNGNSMIWAAVRPQVPLGLGGLREWKSSHEKFTQALDTIQALSLFAELADDGLLLTGLGYVGSRDETQRLYKYLSDRKRDLLQSEGANVFFASFLVLSNLQTQGPYVRGSLRLTGQAIQELWNTKFVVKPTGRY